MEEEEEDRGTRCRSCCCCCCWLFIIIRLAPAFRVALPPPDEEDECRLLLPLLLLLPTLPEAEKPGRKENFESSPTVVTSMSDSSLLLQLSDVLDPVEELSSVLVDILENDAEVLLALWLLLLLLLSG